MRSPSKMPQTKPYDFKWKFVIGMKIKFASFHLSEYAPPIHDHLKHYWQAKWHIQTRYPHNIRPDGGPQFRHKFGQFCKRYGIQHEVASPYHPQTNGQAEVNIWIVKQLMAKTTFNEAFSEFKNTERSTKHVILQMNPLPPTRLQTTTHRKSRPQKPPRLTTATPKSKGLCSSSDEWCWRSDITIENDKGIQKLVDPQMR